MTSVLQALNIAVQAAFVALALFTLTDWIRHRDRQRLWLVVALVSLSALAVLTPAAALIGVAVQVDTDLALVLFVLSGYALLMFRNSLIPLGRRLAAAITAWTALVAIIGVVAEPVLESAGAAIDIPARGGGTDRRHLGALRDRAHLPARSCVHRPPVGRGFTPAFAQPRLRGPGRGHRRVDCRRAGAAEHDRRRRRRSDRAGHRAVDVRELRAAAVAAPALEPSRGRSAAQRAA